MPLSRWGLILCCCALFATEPDNATRQWWKHVRALSGDDLQGRDTGSEGYRKAAAYVVKQLAAASVKPAGENGGWYQSVPMRKVQLRTDLSSIALVGADGNPQKLAWLRDITTAARVGLPESLDAALVFDGEADPNAAPIDAKGKILVRVNAGAAS